MKVKSGFGEEFNPAIKPDGKSTRYADFGSLTEPTAGETGQAGPSSKGRKPAVNRTTSDVTKAEIRTSMPRMTRATPVAMRPTFATNKAPCNFIMATEPPGYCYFNRDKQMADKICVIEPCYLAQ